MLHLLVEGKISENLGSANEQNPSPELLSENISNAPTPEPALDDIPHISSQNQQPSAQSTNVPVHQEGISNDQPHRVTKWTRSHP